MVIAIIGVMVSTLLPAVNGMRRGRSAFDLPEQRRASDDRLAELSVGSRVASLGRAQSDGADPQRGRRHCTTAGWSRCSPISMRKTSIGTLISRSASTTAKCRRAEIARLGIHLSLGGG